MLQRGQRAPSFERSGAGGGWSRHTRSTRTSTASERSFRCATRSIGIGTDSAHSHRASARRDDVGHPLLSDGDGGVIEAYGVRHGEFEDHRDVAASALLVVGTGGGVTDAWRGDGPGDALDPNAVRTAARETDGSPAPDAPDGSAA